MSSKYPLTIDPEYVSSWGVYEGVREILQNSIDQEVLTPNNKLLYNYDESTEILYIGNKSSTLEINTLLLGKTTKADDDKTIGKFGEGYKIGMLALIRAGKTVTIYNYGKREIWRPRFVNSRIYKCQVLTVFVDKQQFWKDIPDNHLMFVIEGITLPEYEALIPNFLPFIPYYEKLDSDKGEILLETEYQGKIFVNGLYISQQQDLHYGYNFKPQYVKVGRNRDMVNNFDTEYYASATWSQQHGDPNSVKLVNALVTAGAPDVKYLTHHGYNLTFSSHAYEQFKIEYGSLAIPVSSQEEYEEMKRKYPNCMPIIVNAELKALITKVLNFGIFSQRSAPITIKERLMDWYSDVRKDLFSSQKITFMDIMNDIEE